MQTMKLLGISSMAFSLAIGSAQSEEIESIGLDTLIRAVVADITRAATKPEAAGGEEARPIYDLGDTTLELQFSLEKSASGKVQANFWSFGSASAEAAAKNQNIQKVQIKLVPSTRISQTDQPVSPPQFSSFNPRKTSILVPQETYDFIQAYGHAGEKPLTPAGVSAKALGVANEGIVVNEDAFKAWLDNTKRANPRVQDELNLDDLTRIEVPKSAWEFAPTE